MYSASWNMRQYGILDQMSQSIQTQKFCAKIMGMSRTLRSFLNLYMFVLLCCSSTTVNIFQCNLLFGLIGHCGLSQYHVLIISCRSYFCVLRIFLSVYMISIIAKRRVMMLL